MTASATETPEEISALLASIDMFDGVLRPYRGRIAELEPEAVEEALNHLQTMRSLTVSLGAQLALHREEDKAKREQMLGRWPGGSLQ